VVNARSRTGKEAFWKARATLEGLGVHIGVAYVISNPERLSETVRRAVVEGHEPVILGGGDGSVSSTVDFLAHQHATLALLPLGTANDFARTLGIPTGLRAACEAVVNGKVVDVDLGLVSDKY